MNKLVIYLRNIFGVPLVARHHKIRIDKMAEQAKLTNPDILLLQEVFLPSDKREIERCFKNEFDIFQSRKGLLNFGGGLCGLFKKGINAEHNYIKFQSSGFLSGLTIVDKIAEKGLQIFKIQKPVEMLIMNTHLTCPYTKSINKHEKLKHLMAEQLNTIQNHINKEKTIPLIVCGDFNLEPTQDIMENFIATSGLHNHATHLHNTILGNFYSPKWLFKSTLSTKKPDYILTKNIPNDWKVSVKKASDHHELISDHIGIITTIEY